MREWGVNYRGKGRNIKISPSVNLVKRLLNLPYLDIQLYFYITLLVILWSLLFIMLISCDHTKYTSVRYMSERKQLERTEQAARIFKNNESKKKKKLTVDYFNGQVVFN